MDSQTDFLSDASRENHPLDSNTMFDLSQRVAVVTGGLGQLGQEFCGELLRRGARVAIFDRQPIENHGRDLKSPTRELLKEALFCEVDVTSKESIKRGLETVLHELGEPQILVNNAGLDSPPGASALENGPFENYPEASWDQVLDVNLKGIFLCSQVLGARMAQNKQGSIINISSIYGMVSPDQRIYEYRAEKTGDPFYKPVAYAVSKSGIYNLTRYLATYWAKVGVRVNTLTLAGVFNHQDDRFLKSYCSRIPVGRMARPSEYNGALVFLASDSSQYMTGSNLVIDGGWTAW